jgi:hypothetical protein
MNLNEVYYPRFPHSLYREEVIIPCPPSERKQIPHLIEVTVFQKVRMFFIFRQLQKLIHVYRANYIPHPTE